MFTTMHIVIVTGFALLLGLNVGMCLGYLWCMRHKRETTPAVQAPVQHDQQVQEVDQPESAVERNYWQEEDDTETPVHETK